MNSNIGRRLGYEDIFDGNPRNFEDYFEGMGKEDIFKAITFLVNAANPDNELFSPDKLIEDGFVLVIKE